MQFLHGSGESCDEMLNDVLFLLKGNYSSNSLRIPVK